MTTCPGLLPGPKAVSISATAGSDGATGSNGPASQTVRRAKRAGEPNGPVRNVGNRPPARHSDRFLFSSERFTVFYLDVVSRVLHVWTAIALVGGSLFTLMVLMPAARTLADYAQGQLAEGITRRWKRFVHLGIALFLLTGFYNYFRAMPLHRGDGLYHALIGSKMLLALGVFFLASAMVGRSEKMAWVRNNPRLSLALLVLLATIVVAISGYTKVRQTNRPAVAPPAAAADDSAAQQAAVGLDQHRHGSIDFC